MKAGSAEAAFRANRFTSGAAATTYIWTLTG